MIFNWHWPQYCNNWSSLQKNITTERLQNCLRFFVFVRTRVGTSILGRTNQTFGCNRYEYTMYARRPHERLRSGTADTCKMVSGPHIIIIIFHRRKRSDQILLQSKNRGVGPRGAQPWLLYIYYRLGFLLGSVRFNGPKQCSLPMADTLSSGQPCPRRTLNYNYKLDDDTVSSHFYFRPNEYYHSIIFIIYSRFRL